MPDAFTFTINGKPQKVEAANSKLLVDVIREDCGLFATRTGCLNGDCGACTIRLNGKVVKACLLLLAEAEGAQIETLERDDRPTIRALQEAFIENNGFQCGFCTTGMLMVAADLLDHNPDPAVTDIRNAIAGNLCRCTGYDPIIQSILDAARKLREAV